MSTINAKNSNVATEGSTIQNGNKNSAGNIITTRNYFSKGKWFGAGFISGIVSSLIATLIFEFLIKPNM
jgi:hypothetical protein